MAEVLDKREGMANQLLMKGHASMLEILTASFGEWPPKGLDINPAIKHDQQVQFNIFSKNSALGQRGFWGMASDLTDKERLIKIHEQLQDAKGLNTSLSHESLHILQGDNSYRKVDTFKKQMSFMQKMQTNLFGQHDATSNIIMNELAEGKEKERLYTKFNDASMTRDQQSEHVRRMNYLRLGTEVQARLHEVIVEGYPRWGKVPANIDEFYAAMKNAGFKMPPEIEKRLESLPKNSSAISFLDCEKGASRAATDLQKVADSFSKEGADTFWNKVMPALYADMITMYGDKLGGKRFGLGSDIKAAVVQKKAPTPSLS